MMPLCLADIDWQFIAFIIFLVISYLVKMFGKGLEEEQPAHPAEEERARRLQEEIRRAIEERQRREAPSPTKESPVPPHPAGSPLAPLPQPPQRTDTPSAMPSSRRSLPEDRTPRTIPPPKPAPSRVVTPRAAKLEEEATTSQSQSLQEMYEMELRAALARQTRQSAFPEEPTGLTPAAIDYLRDIKSLETARKAIVWREIFGPPKALSYS